ncbi:aminotransferase class V-fold PLP-dependent enzyme [Bdellovibrio sp. HCB337]|uniref:aminotransferase class V-fold PLP-dependent enzyme n=1 Tax=Bdellovibrio sp. HCB337 TaxID=3394358 RepID=UPI0039A658E3
MSTNLNFKLSRNYSFEEVLPVASPALLSGRKREHYNIIQSQKNETSLTAQIEVEPRDIAPGEPYYVTAFIGSEILKSLCALHAGGPIYLKDLELAFYKPIGKKQFVGTVTLESETENELAYRFSLAEGSFAGLAKVEKLPARDLNKEERLNYVEESFDFSEVDVHGARIGFNAKVNSREVHASTTCLNKSLILEMIGQLGIIHGHLLLGLSKKTANVWAGKITLSSSEPILDPKNVRFELDLKTVRAAQSDPRVLVADYKVSINDGAITADARMYFDPPKTVTTAQAEVNWDEERKHFPITQEQTYFMNAAMTPYRDEVEQAVSHETRLMTTRGGIGDGRFYSTADSARRSLAQLIGTKPLNLAFLPSTSFGVNIMAMTALQKTAKREVIMPEDEFTASVLPWKHHGFKPRFIQSDKGLLPVEKILAAITPDTAAVMTSVIQFGTGYRQDIARLGRELAARGILFFVNATQALGAFPIRFDEVGITAMTASCHKWLGAGLGVTVFAAAEDYWKSVTWPIVGWRSVTNPWDLDVENPEYRREPSALELGSMPTTVMVAVQAAAEAALRLSPERISERILELSDDLVTKLQKTDFKLATYRASATSADKNSRSGILGIEVDDPHFYQRELIKKGIHITIRRGQLRVAIHYYNSHKDVDHLVTTLQAIRNERRSLV